MVNKKSQSFLEYAILVATVVAAIITMGIYVRRAIYANVKLIEDNINVEAIR